MTETFKLVDRLDPIVNTKTIDIDFSNPQIDVSELDIKLKRAYKQFGGYGITANMIGIPYSAIAIGMGDRVECAFNPKIVAESPEKIYMEEGDLLYPGLILKIKRPNEIRVRYTNVDGSTDTAKFSGLTSRIIQHYIDTLNGIHFIKRASKFHLDQARRKIRK